MNYIYTESPIGPLLLTADGDHLTGVYMNEHKNGIGIPDTWCSGETPVLVLAMRELKEYFQGSRSTFTVPIQDTNGTPFQQRVWQQLRTIPYGETITYGELARRVGNSNASRAVGAANGRNPISIIVPCHRVIGSDGKLTGYAGGETRKSFLLNHERQNSSGTLAM